MTTSEACKYSSRTILPLFISHQNAIVLLASKTVHGLEGIMDDLNTKLEALFLVDARCKCRL